MRHEKTVAFHTLGCKLNFAETSTIARQFSEAGYGRVDLDAQPDVLVINTCSVTDQADQKCRNIVRRAIRHNPSVRVAVVGCYAQLKPEEIASIEGVSVVLGAGEKFNLVRRIEELDGPPAGQVFRGEIRDVKDFVPSFSSGDRTRTFLKVQDGCNYFCAFCTIPLARGRSRSATIAGTLGQARAAAATGAREIVLTGVNIGDFGTAHGEQFIDLCRALDPLEGVERFRISSIEPNLLSDELIDFVASSRKFMPHFHIPLQSGSDEILQRMRRRYRSALYREKVERIMRTLPDSAIGVDVITGFPGETAAHFRETMEFLSDLPVAYLHVFTYSERKDTTALRLDGVVPMEDRQERTRQLRILSEKKKRAFYSRFAGTTRAVLWEAAEEDGRMSGYSDNYLKVSAPYEPERVNRIVPVELVHADEEGFHLDRAGA